MPICSFFLQNRCRFGDSCRFEHPRGGAGAGGGGGAQRNLFGSGAGGDGGQRVTFRDSFGSAGTQGGNNASNQYKWTSGQQTQGGQGATQTSATDLVNGLPKEMDAWEKTKMWPFSCLSVEKELPCLPEFHDISVEEVRFEAYEAQKSGNMQPFNQKLQGLAHQYQTKRNQLRQMSMDFKHKLAAFIDEARRKKTNQTFSTPGSTSSGFGSGTATAAPSGLFGKPSSTVTTPGLFGQTSQGGLFGQPGGATTPFGSPSAFGNNVSSTSLLGTPQQPQNSVFGSQTPNAGGSLFGGGQNTSVTPTQPGAGLFGSQPQTTPSLFGGGSSATGLFGKPATGGPQNPTNSVFGSFSNNTGAAGITAPGTGLFGKPASTPTGMFGNPSAPSMQQPSTGNLFGNPNPCAAPAGLFGSNPASSPAAPVGLFGKPAPAVGAGLFGGVVGQAGQMTAPSPGGGLLPTPSAPATGLFGKGPPQPSANPSSAPGFGLFGNNNTQGTNPPAQGSVFGGGMGSGAAFPGKDSVSSFTSAAGAGANTTSLKQYSSMDELSQQDIDAFKANAFTLGKIPIKPPPRELIMA